MRRPLFTVLTPVFNTDVEVLHATIDSVVRQSWSDWEFILVDDSSTHADVLPSLLSRAESDDRIRVVAQPENAGISAASNAGLEQARGDFLVLLDHDDLLAHGALRRIASELTSDETIDYLYTDEDKIDELRHRYDPFRKPDWSPERLRGQMYTGHVSVLRVDLVREVGGFDSELDGSQDHDLVLKVTERARRIHHIPEVLYHWRAGTESTASTSTAKPYTWDAGVRAVEGHLRRARIDATVSRGSCPNTYAIRRPLSPATSVSVIIPTRGTRGVVFGKERIFVVEAVRSLLARSGDALHEIVVVYDGATPADVLDKLRDLGGRRMNLVRYDAVFNFSEKCNLGFLASTGDRVVFLNDDVQVITPDFISELAAPLNDEEVGMTGAHLFYEDGSVQHAGHQYTRGGYKHPYMEYRMGDTGPFCSLMIDREVSGLTAACVALRRDTFSQVGGMTELLPLNFNDVDLSLKVRAEGHRLLWLNRVQLYHFESKTRHAVVTAQELQFMRARWGNIYADSYIPE